MRSVSLVKGRLVAPAAAATAALAAGSIVAAAAGGATASPSPRTAAAAAGPQQTITASRITRPAGTLAPGTSVGASTLGQRVFPTASRGFALADVRGAQYPAASVDGGRTWKTNGPALHVNAAQAPLVVLDVGAANARTFYAFGGGQVADVTTDGGRTWWRAFLGDVALSVVPRLSGGLVGIAQNATGSGSNATTVVYVSTDGGRHWKLNQKLGAS